MKTRTTVRIVSFITALFVAAGGYIIKFSTESARYKRDLFYDYSASLSGLGESIESLKYSLEKSMYATTPSTLTSLASEILMEASTAKILLARIPLDNTALNNINKFLSQSGDYAVTLSKKAASGLSVTDDERNSLKSLSNTASKLSASINEAEATYNYNEEWEKVLNAGITTTDDGSLADLLSETEDSMKGYPSLIYDGPFSDHILEKEPTLTKGQKQITEAEAKKIAAEAMSVEQDDLRTETGEEGKMPSYKFKYTGGTVAVTKQGGFIVYFRKTRQIDTEKISYEQAVGKADEYLKKHSSYTFESSYYFVENGICTVNFAYMDGDTMCYTDLIKVGVALDSGEIVSVEARGFIANHKQRNLSAPKISLEQAKAKLPSNVKFNSYSMALIPTDGLNEVKCYEFNVTGENNQQILIYINCDTGAEEDILILLKTDGGTMTK